MIELLKALALGFTIGISAALIPGPMMFATVGISLEKGWRAGPFVFLGHSMVELAVILLVIAGASSFISDSTIGYISILGGIVMIIFGLVILKSAKSVSNINIAESAKKFKSVGPVSAGILTTALNPAFILWWLTAGSAIILQEYLFGILAIVAFMIGHWLADFSFLLTVASSTSKGKYLFSERTHRRILYFCSVFLMIFGVWFISNYNNLSSFV
ncbi:LysE family transporter [Methanococcoides alaskense]|uniref:Threonine/homoserine/homoserine lactone efflux protein n=1 Tax=Methanococcoides alaskense TaxID=325778 RepID=A0AA90U107_9EURY|nr:LysE family transporter [Methanococcoides alaskense]MDA0524484.1 LysE family transporter [Methanococcoides alaskense]MDR6223303.1 threonine/homoserine/homoserine lactone efflux protein [Methanococcoides alaskense]